MRTTTSSESNLRPYQDRTNPIINVIAASTILVNL